MSVNKMKDSNFSLMGSVIKYGYLIFILAFAFFPLYVMFVVSFKTNEQYLANPWFFDSPHNRIKTTNPLGVS